jgi:hypothetical protein
MKIIAAILDDFFFLAVAVKAKKVTENSEKWKNAK